MPRNIKNRNSIELESIVKDSTKFVGIDGLSDEGNALLLRVLFSNIAYYFFTHPDNLVQVGFMKFQKNPKKDELFNVSIVYSDSDGISNADTLRKFYRGELSQEKKLKSIVDSFMENLLDYSQSKEGEFSKIKSKLESCTPLEEGKAKKERNKLDGKQVIEKRKKVLKARELTKKRKKENKSKSIIQTIGQEKEKEE